MSMEKLHVSGFSGDRKKVTAEAPSRNRRECEAHAIEARCELVDKVSLRVADESISAEKMRRSGALRMGRNGGYGGG